MIYSSTYIYYCDHKGEPITFFERNCTFPEHKQEKYNLDTFKDHKILSV